MNAPKRNRARVLTPDGLKKLRERLRSHESEENSGYKYTLERLGELTGLDPETVKNVLDCKGSDKRTIARCFETFGLTLVESDHVPAAQATTNADPNFVGRDEAIADLYTLVSRNARVIVIQARGGVGKTTLARKYLQQEFGSFLEFPIAKETKDIASIEGLIEEKLRQLGEEPGREFLVSLDRLKRKLQAECVGILIDNLEPALDSAGKFIEAHRRYVELLRVLSDPTVLSITLITSRERLREVDVTVQHYGLRSPDVKAWEQFFQSRGMNTETPALPALHKAYGGNAKAMDIISGAILEDFSSDVEAYWQVNKDDLFIERDLEDLVTKQFDRLLQLDPDAYKLLCRMGCYRYQDVPTVTIKGLFCLLWDVPENRHRRVVKSLQDRSLVDCEDGEFWLHPVVRAEAIARLRRSKDWDVANRKAAEFWNEIVQRINTVDDAIKAFEAYHHYVEIDAFEQAGSVILKERTNSWIEDTALGKSILRLNLFHQITPAIIRVIRKVKPGYILARLLNMLGTLYWMQGKPHEAIKHHKSAIEMATEYLEGIKWDYENHSKLQRIETSSLLNIGLCQMDLLEFKDALKSFQIAKLIAEKLGYKNHLHNTLFCLAFVNSSLGFEAEAYSLAKQSQLLEGLTEWGRGNRWFFLGKTYKNLGYIDKAIEMYSKGLEYSEESYYTQLTARISYALAELYRSKKEYETALKYHVRSIELLDKLSIKHDLAEAHYQLGLTYQEVGEIDKSSSSFQEAIQFFNEIEAPRQVERVRQSMQNK